MVDLPIVLAIILIILIFVGLISLGIILMKGYSEEFNYNSCLKYDEEDAGICDMIFPPLRFEAV